MTAMLVPSRRISTPSPSRQRSVDEQSSLAAKLEIRLVPLAIDASIAALCDIDLSPGRLTVPSKRRAGLMIIRIF
jgi:hypothetical protein